MPVEHIELGLPPLSGFEPCEFDELLGRDLYHQDDLVKSGVIVGVMFVEHEYHLVVKDHDSLRLIDKPDFHSLYMVL